MRAPQNKILTRYNEVWLDEEGILWVRSREMYEMDLEEAKALFAVYRQLRTDHRKFLHVVDAHNSFTVTREARDYIAHEINQYFRAAAVISNSLPLRLLVNFFNTFYRSGLPLKMFSNQMEALKWLRKFGE